MGGWVDSGLCGCMNGAWLGMLCVVCYVLSVGVLCNDGKQ